MLFLRGKVIAHHLNKIQIDFQTPSACADKVPNCAHRPHAWRLFTPKKAWFDFSYPIKVGDAVQVSLPEPVYHKLLLRLYGLPILALWLGAGLGEMLGANLPGNALFYSIGISLSLFFAAWRLNFMWGAPEIRIQKLKD